jgi:osmotically-inducible protein OsmY
LEELDWDPLLEPNEIGVEVDDGVVTLVGTVDGYSKKVAAERAALRVEGVRAVADMLSVHLMGMKPNDTDIAMAAANALEANHLVPSDTIDVTVQNGNVTLSGEVNWQYQRTRAESSVRYLNGVRDVVNLLSIRQPTASAAAIKSGIERAFVRAAEIDADRVHAYLDGGHVRLTGTVRSWPEKQAAYEAAWRAKGVTRVDNDIVVRPG